MELTAEFAQLQLGFVDQTQRRYEVIRPLVVFADRTVGQRAHETQTHPDTVRKLQRRFQHQGMGVIVQLVQIVPISWRRKINALGAHRICFSNTINDVLRL